MKLRETNQINAAKILHGVVQTTPSRASKMRNTWKKISESPTYNYTDLEALALNVDSNLSARGSGS